MDLQLSVSTVQARINAVSAEVSSDHLANIIPVHGKEAATHTRSQGNGYDFALRGPCAAASRAHSSGALSDAQSERKQAGLYVSGMLGKEGSTASSSSTGTSWYNAVITILDVDVSSVGSQSS